jgi:hypothetical protein
MRCCLLQVLLVPGSRRKLVLSVLGASAAEKQAAAAQAAGDGAACGKAEGNELCSAEPAVSAQEQQEQQHQVEEFIEIKDFWAFKRTCEVCAGAKSRL